MSVISSEFVLDPEIKSTVKESCFHCGEAVTEPGKYHSTIKSEQRPMCCIGCMSVADMIIELGFEEYYERRTSLAERPDFLIPQQLRDSDLDGLNNIQDLVFTELDDSVLEVELLIRGISCPACSWMCEKRLSTLPGIEFINVNYSTHRAVIRWDKTKLDINTIFNEIRSIGYDPKIFNSSNQQVYFEQERKRLIRLLGFAGVLGMQVMMISIALYFGRHNGMQSIFISSFNLISLVLTSLILFVAGKPFFQNAIRDTKAKIVGMDHAVVLGLGLAYLASIYSVLTSSGETYFDTVAMFVFFLSAARYFEFIFRNKSLQQTKLNEFELPMMARKLIKTDNGNHEEIITALELKVGDVILIKAGETIPADGLILSGETQTDESLMTGESTPLEKKRLSNVIAGSVNILSPIECRVTSIGKETTLGQIKTLVDQAHLEKPKLTEMSNKIAGYFISAVFLIAALTIFYHGIENVTLWLDRVIAILIVCCPCALSLAMPTVYTATIGRLAKSGVIFKHIQRLYLLSSIKHFVFDKTGICTTGKLKIKQLNLLSDVSKEQCLSILSSIEAHSEHPAASAFNHNIGQRHQVDSLKNYPGKGISGIINNKKYYIGSKKFIDSISKNKNDLLESNNNIFTAIYLADEKQLLAEVLLEDEVRSDLQVLVNKLKLKNIYTYLCSGDNHDACYSVTKDSGINEFHSDMLPDNKLIFIKNLQDQKCKVAMIGDGINDAPTLAKADVSFSISNGSDLAQLQADAILLGDKLINIFNCISLANYSKKIITQNISWAIGYNILALPIAISGHLEPWMAAIGMSLSSLIVVLNADRIRHYKFR